MVHRLGDRTFRNERATNLAPREVENFSAYSIRNVTRPRPILLLFRHFLGRRGEVKVEASSFIHMVQLLKLLHYQRAPSPRHLN